VAARGAPQEVRVSLVKAFVAGFLATLIFHQGMLALLHVLGPAPAPFNMTPTGPLGVPAVLSLAFFGGLWGMFLWRVLCGTRGARYWIRAIVVGALAPSAFAWFVVMPLKGFGVAGGFDPKIIVGALLVNAAWGLGTGLFLAAFRTAG
jgi:hypothetical protein